MPRGGWGKGIRQRRGDAGGQREGREKLVRHSQKSLRFVQNKVGSGGGGGGEATFCAGKKGGKRKLGGVKKKYSGGGTKRCR